MTGRRFSYSPWLLLYIALCDHENFATDFLPRSFPQDEKKDFGENFCTFGALKSNSKRRNYIIRAQVDEINNNFAPVRVARVKSVLPQANCPENFVDISSIYGRKLRKKAKSRKRKWKKRPENPLEKGEKWKFSPHENFPCFRCAKKAWILRRCHGSSSLIENERNPQPTCDCSGVYSCSRHLCVSSRSGH